MMIAQMNKKKSQVTKKRKKTLAKTDQNGCAAAVYLVKC